MHAAVFCGHCRVVTVHKFVLVNLVRCLTCGHQTSYKEPN